MKAVLLPKPICIHALLSQSHQCVFAFGCYVKRTGKSVREEKTENLENNQKAVQVEMSFPLSTLLLPSTDTLNTQRVEMCFGYAVKGKSYQITSSAFHF